MSSIDRVCHRYLTRHNGSYNPCQPHETDQIEWDSTDAHYLPPSVAGSKLIDRHCARC